jgi:undecaprenyl-diphosphatase
LFVVVATIPTGIIGVAFKDQLEALFAEPRSAAYALIATACILLSSRFAVQRQRPGAKLTVLDAIIVGTAQGIAIIPGISRSGTTITTGLWLGVDAQMAARASFIMSIPAILGALVLQLKDVPVESLEFGPMAVGAAAAFVSGIAAIVAVQRVLKWQGFWMFAPYCLLAAGVGLWMTA